MGSKGIVKIVLCSRLWDNASVWLHGCTWACWCVCTTSYTSISVSLPSISAFAAIVMIQPATVSSTEQVPDSNMLEELTQVGIYLLP